MADTREEVKEYKDRLWGLIPTERITAFKIERPKPEIVAAYRELEEPTPTLADILDGMGVKGIIAASVLKPVIPGKIAVGPAVTLRYMLERKTPTQGFVDKAVARMADRDAYAVAEPGDVVVMDCDGEEVSCMGGLSTTVASAKGLSGCVVYGGIRDVATMRERDYPVWSSHVTPRSGKYRIEAAEINGPITVAGVQVRPGDIIVADDSGIVVVPLELAEEVLRKAQEATAKEARLMELMGTGASLSDILKVLPASKW